MRYSMLQYDIPKNSDVPNPSGRLRKFSVRTSFSVWVVPEDYVPWGLLDEWTENGVRWHLVPFAAEAAEQILALCTDALRNVLDEIRTSLDESIQKAAQKFQEDQAAAHGPASMAVAEDSYTRRVRAAFLRSERLIADAEAAAKCVGVNVGALPTAEVRNAIGALQSGAHQRAAIYSVMASQAQGTAMGPAASASDVPPQVLADFLQDEGVITPTQAEQVGQVFDNTPASAGHQTIASSWNYGQPPAPPALPPALPVQPASPPVPVAPPAPLPAPALPAALPAKPAPVAAPVAAPPAQPAVDGQCCPRCGSGLTQVKQGRYGRFRGCTRFPRCRGLVNIND